MSRFESMSEEERTELERRLEERKKADLDKHFSMMAHKARLGYTSLPEHEWALTFSSLPACDQNREVLARVQRWTPEMERGVFLYGSVGTGKSTICKAIINKWASPSYTCKFITVPDAIRAIKSGMDKPDSSVDLEVMKLVQPNLLVLDDIGVGDASDFSREQLFAVFEARAHSRKHTWFTTNMDPKQLRAHFHDRIADRLLEFCSWVKVEGESFRRRSFRNEI